MSAARIVDFRPAGLFRAVPHMQSLFVLMPRHIGSHEDALKLLLPSVFRVQISNIHV
jgi:hypothetical protein